MDLENVKKALKKVANPEKARFFPHFFKATEDGYGYPDKFLGVSVPDQRKIAKAHRNLPLKSIGKLLQSSFHEHRLTALLILILQFEKGDGAKKDAIIHLYKKNLRWVNNWDLVDTSAPKLLGPYLLDKDRSFLYGLAKSTVLWERRIAILTTLAFIRKNDFADTIKLATILVNDKEDLIHKAVGWMLREVGKKDLELEEKFLNKHAKHMPRTMLRYAIEKFPREKRQFYMK